MLWHVRLEAGADVVEPSLLAQLQTQQCTQEDDLLAAEVPVKNRRNWGKAC